MTIKKVSIIGTVGVPACYGGFETLVENLLSNTEKVSNIRVYCSSKTYPAKTPQYKNATLHYIPLNANGVQSIPYDVWSLFHAAFKGSENILVLGVSGAIFLPLVRLFTNAKFITNIDGLEWRREKWGPFAKKFLKLSEKVAVKFSDIVVADNKAIADYVLSEYGREAEVIAYGGDHAITAPLFSKNDGYALSLCRIEPENNVEMILEAFKRSNKRIKFIGNWNSSEFGLQMKDKYRSWDNIEIVDPIYDVNSLFKIRQGCSFYVHGHSAGGTNPSLVEMMHFNKDILAFDCDYNRATTEEKCHYFNGVVELMAQIENVDTVINGEIMLEIAQRRYTWEIVKQQYFNLFK